MVQWSDSYEDERTIEEQVEDLRDSLKGFAQDITEASSGNTQNQFFTEIFEDPTLMSKILDFALEVIQRFAASDQKTKAVTTAKIVMAALPVNREFFQRKKLLKRMDQEYWLSQIRTLNLEYIGVRRALLLMLMQTGELSVSRELFNGLDETTVVCNYTPETDTLAFRVGKVSARTVMDEMNSRPDLAAAQKEAFEKESGESFEDQITGEGVPLDQIIRVDREGNRIPLDAPSIIMPSERKQTPFPELKREVDPTRLDQID